MLWVGFGPWALVYTDSSMRWTAQAFWTFVYWMWKRVLEMIRSLLGLPQFVGMRQDREESSKRDYTWMHCPYGQMELNPSDAWGRWEVYLQTFVSYCLFPVYSYLSGPPCSEQSRFPGQRVPSGRERCEKPAACTRTVRVTSAGDLCGGDHRGGARNMDGTPTLPATSAAWTCSLTPGREDSWMDSLTSSKKVLVCSTISLK